MFRTALRNVLAHKARLLMTVLAVMLGVAFVSGTLVFTDTLGSAYKNQSAKSYDNVAVSVGYDGDGKGLPQSDVDKIQALNGVDKAAGQIDGFAGVADKKGKLIGQGWSSTGANYTPTGDYAFTTGAAPTGNGQVALDKETADKAGVKVGSSVRIAGNGPVKSYTLSGIFTTDDGAVSAGGTLSLFSTAEAQTLYGTPGYFDTVTVTAKDGANDAQLLDSVVSVLPKDAHAQTGTQLAANQAKSIESNFSSMKTGLLAFAGIALFVGIFLIYNTFAMLVAQRTRELALMRAVGASRKQVTRSVLGEAVLVGLLASAIGFGLGIGLAAGLRPLMGSFGMKVPGGPLLISPVTVAAAFGVGVLVTLISAYLPARRAAKIPPVAAMSSVHAVATGRSLVVRNTIGSLLTLGGAGLIVAGAGQTTDSGRMIIAAGAFLALIGVIVLIPFLSRPVIALVRPLLVGVWGVSGKLAGQNAVRNPRRTGATAAALAIGLTLVTGITTLGVTLGQAVDKMTTDNIKADYLVAMAGDGQHMSPDAVKALAAAPGVTAYSPDQSAWLELSNKGHGTTGQGVTGVNAADIDQLLNLDIVSGSSSGLAKGSILISDKLAKQENWKAGETVTAGFPDKSKSTLTIGGIYDDNEFTNGIVMDTAALDRHLSDKPEINAVYVDIDGGATSANEQKLVDALGANPAIEVMDQQDIRDMFGGIVNTMLNLMYGLLGMALLIAVLGVVNTLAMSVFERQQEIGMLRAIGLDRRRIKRMVRLEAVVISIYGAVIGVGLGAFLAWALGETLKDSIPGYALVLPWERIGIFILLAGVVGILAALWPARSAARLNMLTAIKTE
ncbi:ABC transporter permease [Streptomyces sp. NBC_01465]|uniref:ABC transporter permease n=1 Tax=Streptomyces sp. NBC_01465 TaxID=2903878 RepID=UPI002E34E0EB|nr:FtsX-like permease family protein [Streptomyces sp. NBC_01465]